MALTRTRAERLEHLHAQVAFDINKLQGLWDEYGTTIVQSLAEGDNEADLLTQGGVVRDAVRKALRALTKWESRVPQGSERA